MSGPRLAMMSALPRESYPDRYHLTGGVDKLLNRSGPTFQNIPHCVLMRTTLCCMKLKTSCNCVCSVLLSVFGC